VPQNVKFTSVEIHHFKRSQTKIVARFEFPFNNSASKAMGWGDLQEFESGVNLIGDLAASVISLTPKDESLKRHAVDIEVTQVHKFIATRQEIEGKKDKGTRWVVQCDVMIRDAVGLQKLNSYMSAVPKSDMRISYEKQPEQQDIPGTEVDTGCVACNNGIPLIDGDAKKHVSGARCTARPTQEGMPLQ
jgi:hypothetical protein